MSSDNVTPIRPRARSGFPCDLDTAAVALDQAHGVLWLVTEILSGKGLNVPDTEPLNQAVFAALAEVKRANEAIFGPEPSAAKEDGDD